MCKEAALRPSRSHPLRHRPRPASARRRTRPTLKAEGLLTRDSRVRERKKPGQPGARKNFQFSKR